MLRKTPAVHAAVHAHERVLERRHGAEEADVLERAADAERGDLVLRQPGDVLAVEHDLARRRRVGARQHVEERRLARAVRPDQARDRAARHDEVDVLDGDEPAELLAHAARLEQQVVAHIGCASISSSSSSSSCNSWRRRALGSRPSGRKSMNVTIATP